MTSLWRKPGKLCWLGLELVLAGLNYLRLYARHGGRLAAGVRGPWLHHTALRISRVLGMRIEVTGTVPDGGLLVANHLSYLDIVLIAAITSARFVSKAEVKRWPIFGLFARGGGTLFIDRTRRQDTARANAELKDALAAGQLLVLFPEGTSSDGSTVLPFKSSLLEPVANSATPIYAAHIGYTLPNGCVADEVCYWGEMTLGPHLLNLLGHKNLSAHISFSPSLIGSGNRKELAERLRGEVLRLKGAKSR